ITFVSGCEMLPLYEGKDKSRYDLTQQINEGDLGSIAEMIKKYVKESSNGRDDPTLSGSSFPFKMGRAKGGLIMLTRLRASYCGICKEVHSRVPPYVFTVRGKVYYQCRAAPKDKKVVIGKIRYVS